MENEMEKRKRVSSIIKEMLPGEVEHFPPSQHAAVNSAVWRLNHKYSDGHRWMFRYWSGDKTVVVTRTS